MSAPSGTAHAAAGSDDGLVAAVTAAGNAFDGYSRLPRERRRIDRNGRRSRT